MRDYLSSHDENIAQLQNIVDLLSRDDQIEPRQLIADIDSNTDRSTSLLAQLDRYQATSDISSTPTQTTQESGLEQSRSALQGKLSRMIAADGDTTPTSTQSAAG